MAGYNFSKIEKKWQKVWEDKKLYRTDPKSKKKKYYVLIEFPYPSGDGLHVGHVRSYTAMDIVSRKRRMQGYNVLYPVGWDAFGLPTENYAIKHKVHPKIVTKRNTDTFRRQLKSLGFSFDWEREINTTDPNYYKWTQWIFLKLFEEGLAYKACTLINWCPNDKIGLANEEVVAGRCERCGGTVEKREKEQWMLRITAYADKLLKGLETVDYIPEAKIQQQNWIGRSEGAEIDFAIKNSDKKITIFTTRPDTLFGATYLVLSPEHPYVLNFESRIANYAEVKKYIGSAARKTEEERLDAGRGKTGVELKGLVAINPATHEEIPIWISDYVLASYGRGAIMAVPAHDERDFVFAKKFKLPIIPVIEPVTGEPRANEEFRKSIVAVVENPATGKLLSINWGEKLGGNLFVGGGLEGDEDPTEAAKREIAEETGYTELTLVSQSEIIHHHYVAASKNVYRSIDARGLYFRLTRDKQGTQNLQHDEKDKFTVEWITKEEAAAKVKDPLHAYLFRKFILEEVYTGSGLLVSSGKFSGMDSEEAKMKIVAHVGGQKKVQYRLRDWVFSRQRYWGEPMPLVFCPACKKTTESSKFQTTISKKSSKPSKGELLNPGWIPVPESQLPVELPNVKNYQPTDTGESPLANMSSWIKTKCPRCGGMAKRETDVMPNWAGSSWYFLRYIDPKNKKVFADKQLLKRWMPVDWYNGGMEHTVLHLLYSRFWNQFLFDQKLVPSREPYKKRTAHGLIMGESGVKMSKSKGNVVNPDTVVKEFSADALRIYEMFIGPFNQPVAWDTRSILGVTRFLERVWTVGNPKRTSKKRTDKNLETLLHKTIKKVSDDIESMSFNTAVSACMVFVNECAKCETIDRGLWQSFLRLLAPFAPHISEELWHTLGNKTSVHKEPWPIYSPKRIREEKVTLIVQVNGKMRDSFEVERGVSQKGTERLVFAREKIQALMGGTQPKKIVFVPDRLLNIVL